MPFLETDYMQVVTDMLGDLMDSGHPIEIKIFGNNHEKIKELSAIIGDSLETIEG